MLQALFHRHQYAVILAKQQWVFILNLKKNLISEVVDF